MVYCLQTTFLLTLEDGSPEEETQSVRDKEEAAQERLRKTDSRSLWTYGENNLIYYIHRSSEKMPRKLFHFVLTLIIYMFGKFNKIEQ